VEVKGSIAPAGGGARAAEGGHDLGVDVGRHQVRIWPADASTSRALEATGSTFSPPRGVSASPSRVCRRQ
jgi:hypothetical protein